MAKDVVVFVVTPLLAPLWAKFIELNFLGSLRLAKEGQEYFVLSISGECAIMDVEIVMIL